MKSSRSLYLLIPSVVVVWGIIAYKIYTSGNQILKAKKFDAELYVVKTYELPDTFSVDGTYRDPFLKVVNQITQSSKPISKKKEIQPVAKNPLIVWPPVVFIGSIKNTKNKSLLALVRVNSNEVMIKPGEIEYGIKVLNVFEDSVKVCFQNETKTIFKN